MQDQVHLQPFSPSPPKAGSGTERSSPFNHMIGSGNQSLPPLGGSKSLLSKSFSETKYKRININLLLYCSVNPKGFQSCEAGTIDEDQAYFLYNLNDQIYKYIFSYKSQYSRFLYKIKLTQISAYNTYTFPNYSKIIA